MDSKSVTVLLLLVFGIIHIKANVFEPFKNMLEQQLDANNPGNVINSFLAPFRGTDDRVPINGPIRNPKAWWAVDPTPAGPIIHNIFPPTPTPTDVDYDKIVAEKFPGATNLLEKLKELNKLKEQQKQQGGNNKVTPVPPKFIVPTEPTPDDIDDKTTVDGKLIMKSITAKRFYFQVRPVRPEGEEEESETIYYVSL